MKTARLYFELWKPAAIIAASIYLWFCVGAAALEDSDYTLADGLEIKPAVNFGLVERPNMATWDDDGRLFVVSCPDKKPSLIRRLTDTDLDGVFDNATTFADGLDSPKGALWIYDSLYVMAEPGLWYFEDTNGDGVANVKRLLVNSSGAGDLYGPFLHPNGRIYWSQGRREEVGARIWSCDVNGEDVRAHAGGGMDRPVEMDFTESGEILGSVNFFQGESRSDGLVHWLYGGVYPRGDDDVAMWAFDQTGASLKELYHFDQAGSSGVCRYRSGGLDSDWKNQWLVSHSIGNALSLAKVKSKGSGFVVDDTKSLFQLKKPGAVLSDVIEDRNGEILVLDSGAGGMIYRISEKGGSYSPSDYPSSKDWARFDPIEVGERMRSTDEFICERAITELAIRGGSAMPELRNILKEDEYASPAARRNAVWALARLKFTEAPDLIEIALTDDDMSVQIAACNAISVTRNWQSIAKSQPNEMLYELERNETISGALARLVRAGSPQVARNAAVALGTMAESRAMGALIGRVGRIEDDRSLQHAITYALMEIGESSRLVNLLKVGNARQQNAALWALEGMEHELGPLDIVLQLDSSNEVLRGSVNQIVLRHKEWDAAIANQFFLYTDELNPIRTSQIEVLAPGLAETRPMQGFINYVLLHESSEVAALGEKILPRLKEYLIPEEWDATLNQWLGDTSKVRIALATLEANPTSRFEEALLKVAEDEGRLPAIRDQARRALEKALAAGGVESGI